MKHLGDVTKIDGRKIQPVDVITFGSPCQDLSVAGLRKGLSGERSGLFHESMRIIREMRDETGRSDTGTDGHIRFPRYAIWENVQGALSSNNGDDFRVVLEEMCRLKDKDANVPRLEKGRKWQQCGCIVGNGYSLAWRLHNAEHFGVPQRRRRLCVLIDLDGYTAAELVFELKRKTDNSETIKTVRDIGFKLRSGEVQVISESLPRDSEQGEKERQKATGDIRVCADQTIKQSVVYGISPYASNAMLSKNPNSGIYKADTARTLDLNGGNPACNQGGMAVVQNVMEHKIIGNGQTAQIGLHDKAFTLDCMHDQQAILSYELDRASFNQGQNAQFDFAVEKEKSPTLVAKGPGGGISDTVGSLCARDYKGVGNQYVDEGKVIIQVLDIGKSSE